MPYAKVEDRRSRANARRQERLEEYRAYARAYYVRRKAEDPSFVLTKREQAKSRKQMRLDLLNEIKVTRGCADCGYNADAVALDFDHARGEKEFAISMSKRSVKTILDEVAKCDVVCANCHRIRTRERRS
jgi:hypothetical protein